MGTYNTGKQNKEKKSPGAWDILTDSLSLRVTYRNEKPLFPIRFSFPTILGF